MYWSKTKHVQGLDATATHLEKLQTSLAAMVCVCCILECCWLGRAEIASKSKLIKVIITTLQFRCLAKILNKLLLSLKNQTKPSPCT